MTRLYSISVYPKDLWRTWISRSYTKIVKPKMVARSTVTKGAKKTARVIRPKRKLHNKKGIPFGISASFPIGTEQVPFDSIRSPYFALVSWKNERVNETVGCKARKGKLVYCNRRPRVPSMLHVCGLWRHPASTAPCRGRNCYVAVRRSRDVSPMSLCPARLRSIYGANDTWREKSFWHGEDSNPCPHTSHSNALPLSYFVSWK